MCVTTGRADMTGTMVYGYIPPIGSNGVRRHVVGYQNQAESLSGPNCMLLNYAGTDLSLVYGPERTTSMMADMTSHLEGVEEIHTTRGGVFAYAAARVENYGDYTVVISQSPSAIIEALHSNVIPANRRPTFDRALMDMLQFFGTQYGNDTFVLACFDGDAKVMPTHPIVVSYVPRQPQYITVPGLDGHDGKVPEVGSTVYRDDFKVAFGAYGIDLFPVKYDDAVNPLWAPASVLGFVDNRPDGGPNGNYCLPISLIRNYRDPRTDELDRKLRAPGTELVKHLVLDNL